VFNGKIVAMTTVFCITQSKPLTINTTQKQPSSKSIDAPIEEPTARQ
jgi:hypothetical protein